MAVNPRLFEMLAEAKAQPSGAYKALQAALGAVKDTGEGYLQGKEIQDSLRQRKLKQQTLADALGGRSLEDGIMNFTGETGAIQNKNAELLVNLMKAKKEARQKGTQLFGTRGDKGLVFDPNETVISEIPIPPGDDPIIPKAVTPVLSPYATPGGQPEVYTPGRGLTPVSSGGTGTPVLKQGNDQAINDVSLIKEQIPIVSRMFDSYKSKGKLAKAAQATPLGYVLDPSTKADENALKLSAFTFGGKALSKDEKGVVFNALFPNPYGLDDDAALNKKQTLLTQYMTGKIDLLQAANLLGPAGAPLKGMLQSKLQTGATPQNVQTTDPEADAAIARINASNVDPARKQALIKAVMARSGQQ